ncbi:MULTISPECIES: PepSY-associated TM helix domain-containing protein [unclassified Colwellia]|uniref:PepSY-associated TM helix domain-containing protein n=1 Tax=unclassified Colwellia TaxID=196834 RepID=UPI0015F6A830|nr:MULTISPECIES: PepSY-associated TM helix domain-containing protein [unclassified Colwellia]MBA6365234.1 PepSY domain-containing protein [Colwellia sp. BRX8-8]MBA6372802.1 PepSY domain-containing protein [Colwellia sp. BRX8-4]MBA6381139.1 PepSY domain-containing protein [Colwellia sp. BRX10-7]MBA6388803.1 PepSY domain-containing protein [Colwellia sp. BRX10-2]MBA6403607.1 PepSY domain-containing protein [Colwellia sp. BRX10-5]
MINKKSAYLIRNRFVRHLRKWHRQLGIFAALFLIFLSISGVALNHTSFFSLSDKSITSSILLNHYGIKPPSDIRFYQQKEWLVTDQLIWLNDQVVFQSDTPVIGISRLQSYLLLVTTKQLVIFTDEGLIIDKIDNSSDLPTPISAFSIIGDQLVLNTPEGYFQGDSDFFEWQKITTLVEPSWVESASVTENELVVANKKFQSQFLNWERVILDAHSGRLFGNLGVWFMDIVALMLILLSVSGIYIWLKFTYKKR